MTEGKFSNPDVIQPNPSKDNEIETKDLQPEEKTSEVLDAAKDQEVKKEIAEKEIVLTPEHEKPKTDIRIGLFYKCKNVDELPDLLTEALKEGPLGTVMFKEFVMDIDDVLKNIEKLRLISQERNIDLIIAPKNNKNYGYNENHKGTSWGQIKNNLKEKGIVLEETDFPEDECPDTFGLAVQKNGSIFVFPKSLEKKPLHRIPNTNTGITICGEIDHIKSEDLEGIDLIYNPSEEEDDLLISARMEIAEFKKENGIINKETIEKILKKNKLFSRFNQFESSISETRIKKDMDLWGYSREFAIKLIEKDQVNNRAEFYETVDKLYEQVSNGHLSSSYGSEFNDTLAQKNILVVRCDASPETSGVLNPEIGASITRLDYQKFTSLNITNKEK